MQRSSHGWVYVSAEDITSPAAAATPQHQSRRNSYSSASTDSERGDTENYASLKVKVFCTVLAYLLMIGMSFTYSLLGPCLLDIANLYSIPSDTAATIFLWRGIGSLVGSIAFGKLYDMFRESVVLIPAIFLGCAVTAAIPWASMYAVASLLFSLQGLSMASLNLCSHMLLLRYWGNKNGPFLQALHLMYPIAALVAPQVAQPFLLPMPEITNATNPYLTTLRKFHSNVTTLNPSNTSSILTLYVTEPSSASNESHLSHSTSLSLSEHNFNDSIEYLTVTPQTTESRIYYVFIINAGVLLLLTFISFIPFCFEPHITRNTQVDNMPQQEKSSLRKRVFEKFLWSLFFLSAVSLGSLEVSASGLLFTFLVEYLHWTKQNGTLLLTIAGACYGVGRLIGIPSSSFLQAKIILGIDYILILASLFCLTILVHLHPLVVWVCYCIYMLGVATVFASTLTWARDFFHVSGVFTSLYMVGYSIGLLAGPPLVGFLLKKLNPLWFCYMLIVFAGSLSFFYTILLLLSCFIKISRKKKKTPVDITEMRGMLDPMPLEGKLSSENVTINK